MASSKLHLFSDCCIHCQIVGVPNESNYVLAILAIGVEAFLFANHLHDGMRDENNIQLHTLLVYVIIFCLMTSLAEAFCDKKLACLAILRCVAFLWQGVWFYHLGFTLFPVNHQLPSSGENSNHQGATT